jgi:hypothetical protein
VVLYLKDLQELIKPELPLLNYILVLLISFTILATILYGWPALMQNMVVKLAIVGYYAKIAKSIAAHWIV